MKWQGKQGLQWFTGIVEDRDDPLFLNRVRVRIYGVHTHEKDLIATPDLPWSQVLMPVTSPSLSGLGATTHGLVEGSTVMGFWRDGLTMQDPVIMGSFIGQPEKYSRKVISAAGGEEKIDRPVGKNDEKKSFEGFNDPRLEHAKSYEGTPDGPKPQHLSNRGYGLTLDLENSPHDADYVARDNWPPSEWLLHEQAQNYPKESYLEQSDVNKLARGDGKYHDDVWPNNFIGNHGGFFKYLKNTLDVPLTMYDANALRIFAGNNEDRSSWVKPKYPFNHVYESESGHVIEIDDTPGYERINLFHRKGARIEINNEGEIHIIAAPHQDINLQGANVNIRTKGSGDLNIATDAVCNISAAAECTIKAEADTTIVSKGKTKLTAFKELAITALKDVAVKSVKKVKIQ